jgi:dipeptidase
MPGRRIRIPQVLRTQRNMRVSYSHYLGVPAPITNGGVNASGVAVRDVWSTSRGALIAMTPRDQTGPNYSDLARIVLERATSARQAVEICAELIADFGESTYGGNSHLFADEAEAWVMIQFAGGRGLWVAERLGADSIRVSRPGYVLEVPVDQPDHPDFLYPPHFVGFAREMGWYQGGAFNANQVYGDGKGRWEGCAWIEGHLRDLSLADGIGLQELIWALRTPELTGDTAGYGQVVPLLRPVDPALRMMWHCPTGAIAAPFAPVWLGQANVPGEFGPHRYLTEGEAHRFMDSRKDVEGADTLSLVPQGAEATRSAVAEAKRLLYLMQLAGEEAQARIARAFGARETGLAEVVKEFSETAEVLAGAGALGRAVDMLEHVSWAELLAGHRLVMALAAGLEAELTATGALRGAAAFGSGAAPKGFPQLW